MNWLLIVGIIFFILGILMGVKRLDFLLDRYEFFAKLIRKRELSVDRVGLRQFYMILFFVLGGIILIGGIVYSIAPDLNSDRFPWIYSVLLVVGLPSFGYLIFTKRFIQVDEKNTNDL